ncbi:DUF2849 domain-containing protein [Aristophania vespae]|uniref:DUF2849 domain-containing protein n=1 Tax=Aristophania vespae TaxID=2697033 RepID=UPI0023515793|nr:DUF2849 domain-containing protein [Aristophania vespae]UMM64125.1 hypothetical protein DM15PD_11160 [Aristophania vespae]
MKRLSRPGPGEALLLTANRLLDGRIIWCDSAGSWHEDIRRAAQMTLEKAEMALETEAQQAQKKGLVGLYEVLVKVGPVPQPVSVRERVRAFGPTVHPDFAYPSAGAQPSILEESP